MAQKVACFAPPVNSALFKLINYYHHYLSFIVIISTVNALTKR
eukprot:COSAG06_NODE_23127_length_701_cov_34844.478405_2_plen_42_part_01